MGTQSTRHDVLREICASDFVLRSYGERDVTGFPNYGWELLHVTASGPKVISRGSGDLAEELMPAIDRYMLAYLPERTANLPLGRTIFELNELASPEDFPTDPARWESLTVEQRKELVTLFDAYHDAGLLTLADTSHAAGDDALQIVKAWAQSGGFEDPGRNLIIAPDRADHYLVDLNANIQWVRWRRGEVGAERFCYQWPGRRASSRHLMFCEGDRVILTPPADSFGLSTQEFGTVVGIDRRRAVLTAQLDRGDAASVSLAHLLDGRGLNPPTAPVALGYAVDRFPRNCPNHALVVLSHGHWDENFDVIRLTTMRAAVLQKTAGGNVRFFVDPLVYWLHDVHAHSVSQRQLTTLDQGRERPRQNLGMNLTL